MNECIAVNSTERSSKILPLLYKIPALQSGGFLAAGYQIVAWFDKGGREYGIHLNCRYFSECIH